MNKYGFKKTNKPRNHSVQEIAENDLAEIRVDTRIRTDILVKHNRPDIFIYDNRENMVILVEIISRARITCSKLRLEKKRKYDLLANELEYYIKQKLRYYHMC
ncbi:hypothetical protein TCON_0341 [Astathelohania contejeani]|uniref:Uncharacterized protein n=1 Tax=Astathelohania contejeani TaxID=164912 RepID=A0ABQ7I1Y8_9MICR|nr:hypothetical protein TCON_0341 [Thelohania contejeani]